MIAVPLGALLLVVLVLWLRRRAKRALVAGLDTPSTFRPTRPGRMGRPSGDVL